MADDSDAERGHQVIPIPHILFPQGRIARTRYPAMFCAVRSLLPALVKLSARECRPKAGDTDVTHARGSMSESRTCGTGSRRRKANLLSKVLLTNVAMVMAI